MSISELVPQLRPMVEDLNHNLQFICYFILTAALIVKTGKGGNSISNLVRPVVSNIIICGIIATLPMWFNLIRDAFWNIAVSIRQETTGSVNIASTGAALLQLIQPPATGINWLDVQNSIFKAVQYAIGWFVIWVGGIVQLPMLLVQYVGECLCYLFLPIAISLFAFESTKSLAIRYIQYTLAILAWPIGFAVVDLVGYSILTIVSGAVNAGAHAAGAPTIFAPATLINGSVAAIWLILGSLGTPIVMHGLFCSGTPMSSAIGNAVQMGLGFAGVTGFIRGGGGGGGSGGGGPSTSGPSEGNPIPSSPSSPPPNSSPPSSSITPYTPRGPITPSSGLLGTASSSPAPLTPLPSGMAGMVQTARGSLAIGPVADRISPAQAQSFANQSGTPFTQAFSSGQVVTHQPTASRVPPASTFIAPLTPNPIFA